MKLSKEEFVEYINGIQELDKYYDELNAVQRKYQQDYCSSFEFKIVDYLVDTLEEMFTPEGEDRIDDISYFIWEVEYGRRITEAPDGEPWVIKEDGTDISDSFTSAEKLYDYLAARLSE